MARGHAHYQVKVLYREPTYALRVGTRKDPYAWTYTLPAADEQAAIDGALAEFRHIARLSGAGWIRTVVAVEVTRLTDGPALPG